MSLKGKGKGKVRRWAEDFYG
jgi:hypothetical protein